MAAGTKMVCMVGAQHEEGPDIVDVVEQLIKLVGEKLDERRYLKLEAFWRGGGEASKNRPAVSLGGGLDGLALKAMLGFAAAFDLALGLGGEAAGQFVGAGKRLLLRIRSRLARGALRRDG